MSEKSIPLIVTVAIIALMFSWLQVLNFAFPRWRRALRRRRMKMMNLIRDKEAGAHFHQTCPDQAVAVSSLSSRRLANQSRDLRQALYTREERGASHSQPITPDIS
jgi:hypothetical protein